MTREEILRNAREAQDCLARAAAALEEFVGRTQDTSAAHGAERGEQARLEALGGLNEALALLVRLATPAATGEDLPRCMRCDKPVERLGITPKAGNPEVVRVEFECHNEVVSQELPASAVEGGLSRYTAFNAYTSGLMPKSPE